MNRDILHWWYRGNERKSTSSRKGKLHTKQAHSNTLNILQSTHSKLFHTLTLILQKERERFLMMTLEYFSLLVEFYGFFLCFLRFSLFSTFFLLFFFTFFTCFSTDGTSSFYRSLGPWVDEDIRIQLAELSRWRDKDTAGR